MQPPKVFQCQEAKKKEDRAIEKLNRQQDRNWRNESFEVARDACGGAVHFKITLHCTPHSTLVIFAVKRVTSYLSLKLG